MKSYKLSEAEALLIGKKGTKERDEYEFELKLTLQAFPSYRERLTCDHNN